jgi:phosphotransferase system enzyme I (PtsI)
MVTLEGIASSKGIGMGCVFIKEETSPVIEKKKVQSVDAEIQRLENAKLEAVGQLVALQRQARENIGESEAAIFEAHQMMLQDESFMSRIAAIISDEGINAEYALKLTEQEFVSIFASMDDAYMQERAADIRDISKRLMDCITGSIEQSLADLPEPVIIVAKDLLPSDTVQMDRKKVLGVVTEQGGAMSHLSILARTMQIPAVAGVGDILATIEPGDFIIVHGDAGQVIVNPDETEKGLWQERQREYGKRQEALKALKGTKSQTKDGVEIRVAANIGTPGDVADVIDNDAEGIGLFRTEYLYMQSDAAPSEDTQFAAYKTVLEQMANKPVVIRTLDVGGDKEISYLQIPKEDNPFLGYRGIRVSLGQTDIFKTQLRALFRASVYGKLGIMFPMISTLEELYEAKKLVEEVKAELTREGISFRQDVEIGMMIETPAAALTTHLLAKEVDFFSVGTNDLTQYTIAVDRMNTKVARLYNTHHPAVLHLVEMTIENGHKEGIWVGICGEAAADPSLVETFVNMGVDELSVRPRAVLEVRGQIQEISLQR